MSGHKYNYRINCLCVRNVHSIGYIVSVFIVSVTISRVKSYIHRDDGPGTLYVGGVAKTEDMEHDTTTKRCPDN